MKKIYLIFYFLSTTFCCNSSVPNNDSLKKVIIEWVGETDKPIKSINICVTCKDDLKQSQYKVLKTTLNKLLSVLKLNNEKKSIIKVSINESNRDVQKQKLIYVLNILKTSKENEELINQLEIFVSRIQ